MVGYTFVLLSFLKTEILPLKLRGGGGGGGLRSGGGQILTFPLRRRGYVHTYMEQTLADLPFLGGKDGLERAVSKLTRKIELGVGPICCGADFASAPPPLHNCVCVNTCNDLCWSQFSARVCSAHVWRYLYSNPASKKTWAHLSCTYNTRVSDGLVMQTGLGEAKSQGITSHSAVLFLPVYSSFSTRSVNIISMAYCKTAVSPAC